MRKRSLITIGFSSHRIEVIPFARRLIRNHDVIIIEEAPNPKFIEMLNGNVSIDEYLEEGDMEFLEFSRRIYKLLCRFYMLGKEILQIEPYVERLMSIYNVFSDGKKPSDVLRIPKLRKVYDAERKATAALLHFYESSLSNSFPGVIDAVKNFARADAERFRLRDEMRAEAIAKVLREDKYEDKMVYVEAGSMHSYLEKAIRCKLGRRWNIRSEFLLGSVIKKLTGEKEVIPPGDLLTTHYILRRKYNEEYETLQAARSLIYIKILEKEEMIPSVAEKTPHIKDEIRVNELVSKLSLAECRELYSKIRFLNRLQALEVIQGHLRHYRK